jgi:hypothetical protein
MSEQHFGWRDASKENFGRRRGWDNESNPFTVDEVTCGALCRIADAIELLVEAIHPEARVKLQKRISDQKGWNAMVEESDRKDKLLHKKMADAGFPPNVSRQRIVNKVKQSHKVENYDKWNPRRFDWSTLPLTANQQKMIDLHIGKQKPLT